IGNTRTKVAVYENNIIYDIEIFEQPIFRKKIQNVISKCNHKPNILLTSVKNFSDDDAEWLSKISNLTIIDSKTPLPFINKYSTPETLGIDRRVLASGAVLKFPKQNRLVIDAGTCITYDFITANDEYLGGAISPGINLKYKSLND